VPQSAADYGDGGAYPEVHVSQYPLNLGRPGRNSSKVLSLRSDASGKARHDMVVQQFAKDGKRIQSQFTDLVEHRLGANEQLARPTTEEEADTTARTKAALERLIGSSVSNARPTKMWNEQNSERHKQSKYFRYAPDEEAPGYSEATSQRIIKVMEAPVDPMAPPSVKHKKVPGGPPSPPVPVMHKQAKKITVAEQLAWKIPPCVSNWKNNKGYTVPLDKRLAADGRSLRQPTINNKFANLSEALYIAEQKASEEVRQRAEIQRQLTLKKKADKEEELRQKAMQARMSRAGIPMQGSAVGGGAAPVYGSHAAESDSDEERPPPSGGDTPPFLAGRRSAKRGRDEGADFEGVDDAAVQREKARLERRSDRERDLRMEANGKKAKTTRDADRDVSERIALGMPVAQKLQGESMYDTRLFNQDSGLSSGFAREEEYGVYDKAWRSSAATSVYRPTKAAGSEHGTADQQMDNLTKARVFKPDVDFEGVNRAAAVPRSGPVAFTRESDHAPPAQQQGDAFGLDQYMTESRGGGAARDSLDHIGRAGGMAASAGGAGTATRAGKAPAFRRAGS